MLERISWGYLTYISFFLEKKDILNLGRVCKLLGLWCQSHIFKFIRIDFHPNINNIYCRLCENSLRKDIKPTSVRVDSEIPKGNKVLHRYQRRLSTSDRKDSWHELLKMFRKASGEQFPSPVVINRRDKLNSFCNAITKNPRLSKNIQSVIVKELQCSCFLKKASKRMKLRKAILGLNSIMRLFPSSNQPSSPPRKQCIYFDDMKNVTFHTLDNWIFGSLPNCEYLKLSHRLLDSSRYYDDSIFANVTSFEINISNITFSREQSTNKDIIYKETYKFLSLFKFIVLSLPAVRVLYFNDIRGCPEYFDELQKNPKLKYVGDLQYLRLFVHNMTLNIGDRLYVTKLEYMIFNLSKSCMMGDCQHYPKFYWGLNAFKKSEVDTFVTKNQIFISQKCGSYDSWPQKGKTWNNIYRDISAVGWYFRSRWQNGEYRGMYASCDSVINSRESFRELSPKKSKQMAKQKRFEISNKKRREGKALAAGAVYNVASD